MYNRLILKCNITFIVLAGQSKSAVGVGVAFIIGEQYSQGLIAC